MTVNPTHPSDITGFRGIFDAEFLQSLLASAAIILNRFCCGASALGLLCCCTFQVCADPPSEALSKFRVADGLSVELAVAEPEVAQPVYLTFDERGRMWVVQYLQYPFPAGLKVVGHDEYWRVKYDHFPPPPPPHQVPGADKVTIYQDLNGDGHFKKIRDFVTGLNICTAALPGRNGVWVLNPPYLLYYPDANRDDVPDGDPVVHLEGFGMEDLHAVANSLTWGPDGWLYGCQGSTCTATIKRPGLDREGVSFKGQCIWRYHPETRRFELFAEGGYNNFGIAFDDQFRLFTGSNGGIIGVHYVQNGYYQKTWAKHGPLTNPYAFGWLNSMRDQSSGAKLSQAMIIYEADALPALYHDRMLVARALQRRIDLCELTPNGSTYSARELNPILSSTESGFRPVDIKIGPDGAVYIADWNEENITWNVTAGGKGLQKETGRIYRLASKSAPHAKPFDMGLLSSKELISQLNDSNIWRRQTALRILWDRRDPTLVPELAEAIISHQDRFALEALWALYASKGLTIPLAARLLKHPNPDVRGWAVRLLGDENLAPPDISGQFVAMAAEEPNSQVRSQLASTARKLPVGVALKMVAELMNHPEDLNDPNLPLLCWWVVEAKLRENSADVLSWLRDASVWKAALFRKTVASRLGERFTAERSRENLEICAHLLDLAPDAVSVAQVVSGMARGLAGRRVENVPVPLQSKLAELKVVQGTNAEFVLLGLRLGQADAISAAAKLVENPDIAESQRLDYLRLLSESGDTAAIQPALALMRGGQTEKLRLGGLEALQRYGDDRVGEAILASLGSMNNTLRLKALTILVSRPAWTRQLLKTVQQNNLSPRAVPLEIVFMMRMAKETDIRTQAEALWGKTRASSKEQEVRFQTLSKVLDGGTGNPISGQSTFVLLCASCHTMFGTGGRVGPDLTGLDRKNRNNLLRSVLNPSEVILPEYQAWQITLKDTGSVAEEQTLTGFIENENANTLTLKNTAGTEVVVARADVAQKTPLTVSVMPEGLLDQLSNEKIIDLFAFLQSDHSPNKTKQ